MNKNLPEESKNLILKTQIINQIIDTNLFLSPLVKMKAKRFLEELVLMNGDKLNRDPNFKKVSLTSTPDFSQLSEIDKLF